MRRMRVAMERAVHVAKLLPGRWFARFAVKTIGPLLIWLAGRDRRLRGGDRHVLILRNKFYSKGSRQPSTEEMHLDNTLRASGLATFDTLTYDHDLRISPISDLQLILKCLRIRPNAIILSSWWHAPNHPSVHSLKFIREQLGIPVAAIWWDTCSESFWKSLQPVKAAIDVHAIVDNPRLHFIDHQDPMFARVLQLWVPQDENLFKPGKIRDIPLSFSGQVSSYRSNRAEVIEYLAEMQIPGCFLTKDRKDQVSHAEYAEIMGRSQIVLNFSQSVSCHQMKSRVLEAMFSGAMLLESENDQTNALFTPMKDFVPFGSMEDLVDKIKYYLCHADEMVAIASHGRAAARAHYSSLRFWELLLSRIELVELK